MRSKDARFMEYLHGIGVFNLEKKISIIVVLHYVFYACFVMFVCFHVFYCMYELLLILFKSV